MSNGAGLLGGQQPSLIGGGQPGTQNMMAQYLQSLFMRRYNPPAIQQQPGMVGSQMGQGGMQYMAPQVQQSSPMTTPLQEQLARLEALQQQQTARNGGPWAITGGGDPLMPTFGGGA